MNIIPIQVELSIETQTVYELSIENDFEIELISDPTRIVDLFVEANNEYEMALESNLHEIELKCNMGGADYPTYDGITEVTPSREGTVLRTKDTVVLENIVVNPIPSNWGLIGWNGSYLTVS